MNLLLEAGRVDEFSAETLLVPLRQAESGFLNGAEDWEKFLLWMKLGSLRQAIDREEDEDLCGMITHLTNKGS